MEDPQLTVERIIFSKGVLEIKGKPVLQGPFTSLRFHHYPATARFAVNIDFHPVESLGQIIWFLMVRIRKGDTLIYESAPRSIDIESNPRNISMRMSAHLQDVKFPEPGQYLVEIVLDGQSVHTEDLLLEEF